MDVNIKPSRLSSSYDYEDEVAIINRMTSIVDKLGEVLGCEIIDTTMTNAKDTEHDVRHRYKEEIIVPLVAITKNIDFLMGRGKKTIHLTDGTTCEVVKWSEIHLLDMDDEVKKMYNMSAWDFAKRWYSYDKGMQSMTFIKMQLKKI